MFSKILYFLTLFWMISNSEGMSSKKLNHFWLNFICYSNEGNHQIMGSENIIHLKFFNSCLTLYNSQNIKDLKFKVFTLDFESKQNDQNIEIFVLNERDNHFVRQQPFGHLYNPEEFVLISINVSGAHKNVC